MAKNTNATAATANYADAFQKSFEALNARIEVPGAARELARQNVSKAREGFDAVEKGLNNFTASADKAAASVLDSYRSLNRELFDAGVANIRFALDGFARLAEARTVADAVQVQTDIVREGTQSNIERVQKQAELARSLVTENMHSALDASAQATRKAA